MKKNIPAQEINRLLKSGTKLFFTDADHQTRAVSRVKTINGVGYALFLHATRDDFNASGNILWIQLNFSDLEQQP